MINPGKKAPRNGTDGPVNDGAAQLSLFWAAVARRPLADASFTKSRRPGGGAFLFFEGLGFGEVAEGAADGAEAVEEG